MLQHWLESNKAKKLDEIFTEFEKALRYLDWNAAAQYFSEKVEEYKQRK